MGVNVVIFGDSTLVDLREDTVTPDALVVGHTAHGANGEAVAGANPYDKTATDTEVQTQADLIAQISAALEGKGGSGGGVGFETCTLNLVDEIGAIAQFCCLRLVDGKIEEYYSDMDPGSIVISDVVCGVMFTLSTGGFGYTTDDYSGCEWIAGSDGLIVMRTTVSAGGIASVTMGIWED